MTKGEIKTVAESEIACLRKTAKNLKLDDLDSDYSEGYSDGIRDGIQSIKLVLDMIDNLK